MKWRFSIKGSHVRREYPFGGRASFVLMIALCLLVVTGCSSSSTSDKIVEAVSKVPQGGFGYFNVTVLNRARLSGPVTVTIEKISDGIEVVNGNNSRVLEKPQDTTANFTLKANPDVSEQEKHTAKVRVQAKDFDKSVDVNLFVREFQLDLTGLLVLIVSNVSVLALVAFCIIRVFRLPPVDVEEHLKGPLEIDTRDTEDAD